MRACSEHVIRVQRCCVSKKVREAICLVDVQKPINIAMVRFFANVIYNKLILLLAIQLYFGASITVFNIFYLMTSKPFPQKQWQNHTVFFRAEIAAKKVNIFLKRLLPPIKISKVSINIPCSRRSGAREGCIW